MKIIDKRKDKETEETYEDHDVVALTRTDCNETLAMIACISGGINSKYHLIPLEDENKDCSIGETKNYADNPTDLINMVLQERAFPFIKAKKVKAELIIK